MGWGQDAFGAEWVSNEGEMASIKVRRFGTAADLQHFLNGAVRLPKMPAMFEDIVGLTLVFAQPAAATVTFTAGTNGPNNLSAAEVVAQIKAGVAGLKILPGDDTILVETTPTNGVSITSGTALAKMGLADAALLGKVVVPVAVSVTPPCLINVLGTGNGQYECLTYE